MQTPKSFTIGKSETIKILIFPSLTFLCEENQPTLDKLLSLSSKNHQVIFYIKTEEKDKPFVESLKKTHAGRVEPLLKCTEEFHLAFSFGGDGTILWLNQFLRYHPSIPIISFNTGHLGFLTPFKLDQLELVVKSLEDLLEGKSEVPALNFGLIELKKLDFCLKRAGGTEVHATALNEVVLKTSDNYARNFKVYLDDRLLMNVNCDGLIVASQTGSTAYNSSLNGPIIVPDTDVIVINALAPFNCNFRPVIVGKHHSIKIELAKPVATATHVNCDSTDNDVMMFGDSVTIHHSGKSVQMLCFDHLKEWIDKTRSMFHL